MVQEMEKHLKEVIIPFWMRLQDKKQGGFYGYMNNNLQVDKMAVKGCILHSRITWFFANAYLTFGNKEYLEQAKHGYDFLKKYCFDKKNGGIYWSVTYDGKPYETLKHTYNQAFCIYALSSYYAASEDEGALELAWELYELIENKCRDEVGYLEAFDESFHMIDNDKLSENGIIADKTMNTLLHVFEAYTELYRVTHADKVGDRLKWIMDVFADQVYSPEKHRLEVFFDKDMNSILDLQSYGHDIEAA